MTLPGWLAGGAASDGRVVVRALRPDDAERLELAFADPLVQRWIPVPAGPDRAARWLEAAAAGTFGAGRVAVGFCAEGEDVLAGIVTARRRDLAHEAALGYWTVPDGRGRGLTAGAVALVAAGLFATHAVLRRIELLIVPGNAPSEAVARRVGAVPEGLRHLGQWFVEADVAVDVGVWAVLRPAG